MEEDGDILAGFVVDELVHPINIYKFLNRECSLLTSLALKLNLVV